MTMHTVPSDLFAEDVDADRFTIVDGRRTHWAQSVSNAQRPVVVIDPTFGTDMDPAIKTPQSVTVDAPFLDRVALSELDRALGGGEALDIIVRLQANTSTRTAIDWSTDALRVMRLLLNEDLFVQSAVTRPSAAAITVASERARAPFTLTLFASRVGPTRLDILLGQRHSRMRLTIPETPGSARPSRLTRYTPDGTFHRALPWVSRTRQAIQAAKRNQELTSIASRETFSEGLERDARTVRQLTSQLDVSSLGITPLPTLLERRSS
jgi:hypothetical protein